MMNLKDSSMLLIGIGLLFVFALGVMTDFITAKGILLTFLGGVAVLAVMSFGPSWLKQLKQAGKRSGKRKGSGHEKKKHSLVKTKILLLLATISLAYIYFLDEATWNYLVALYQETDFGILPTVLLYVGSILGAAITAITIFLLISPFFKDQLLHDPDEIDESGKSTKLAMFVEVGTGRSVAIDWGGNFAYQIDDERVVRDKNGNPVKKENGEFDTETLGPVGPEFDKFALWFRPWMLYKWYIWYTLQLHVYLPYFTEPKSYDLPRYEVVQEEGKKIYTPIKKGSEGYRSNHVRTAPFTWNFEFAGADIETVPYTVKGSAQVMIDRKKVKDALYLIESWNILLDQVLNSVSRAVVRLEVTIDEIVGAIQRGLWDKPEPKTEAEMNEMSGRVAKRIFAGVQEYAFDKNHGHKVNPFAGKKLADLGIIVLKIDITDFEDELTKEERLQIRASALGRQQGRARDLKGQGVAKEQEYIAAVLERLDSDLRDTILRNRSLVEAVSEGGTLETLLTTIIQNLNPKQKEKEVK